MAVIYRYNLHFFFRLHAGICICIRMRTSLFRMYAYSNMPTETNMMYHTAAIYQVAEKWSDISDDVNLYIQIYHNVCM